MSESKLRAQAKAFAKSILIFCRKLSKNRVEKEVVGQLLRAGTSVGANIHEAQYAQGKKDFISKLEIALKECNETEFWLELLHEVDSISDDDFQSFRKECLELRRMLIASVTTAKKSLNQR